MSDLNIAVSKELVQPIIEAKIHAAIVGELNRSGEYIEAAVTRALSQKVDGQGKPTDSPYYKTKFVEYVCIKAIQDAAKTAIQEYVQQNQEKVNAAVKKVIAKQTDAMAVRFVESIIHSAGSGYMLKVDLKVEQGN